MYATFQKHCTQKYSQSIVRLGSAYEIAGRFMIVKNLVLSKKVKK